MLPTVQAGYNEMKAKHGKRMIIGGLDIGQRLSGVSLKLLAFERLLQDYPSWQHKVVMVQRVLLPGSRQSDEVNTVRELRFVVKRIQETFGHDVIDYQEMSGTSMPMDQRLALWKASDVLMLTPIREGLNHWPMEYIYAHKEPSPPGIVIASEFSAVCSILNGALRVNPFDIQMTITTIDKALSMDMQEREVGEMAVAVHIHLSACLSHCCLMHRAVVIATLISCRLVRPKSGRGMSCGICEMPSFDNRRAIATVVRRRQARPFQDGRS